MATVSPSGGPALARQVRARFADEAAHLLEALPGRISAALEAPETQKTTTLSRFAAMEAEAGFRQKSGAWLKAAQQEWRRKTQALPADNGKAGLSLLSTASGDLAGLTLVDNDAMDRTVTVGRLALAILDKAGRQLSDLRARVQHLEGGADFAPGDVFRPETIAQALLDTWAECGLSRLQWDLAQDAVHQHMVQGLTDAYAHANAFLMEHGVTAEIDLRAKVRRAPDRVTVPGRLPSLGGASSIPGALPGNLYPTGAGAEYGLSDYGMIAGGFAYAPPGSAARAQYEAALYPSTGSASGTAAGMGGPAAGNFVYAPPGSAARAQYEAALYSGGPMMIGGSLGAPGPAASASPAATGLMGDGVSVAVSISPLGMLQQQRAQGVLGNLRQFALQRGVALVAGGGVAQPVSPLLALALAEPVSVFSPGIQARTRQDEAEEIGQTELDQTTERLKRKAQALKDKAERPDEKATIEIVSLMFQAILADEHMPPALRVWFGRLQVPVLRVALAEPEFFAAPDHPARLLIDRMGACAMGLDGAEVDGGQLEQEIKRIVQLIEQYPETGQKVFQIALDEFEKILKGTLAQGQSAQKFATLAQQIEQKDALAIQYTIELRNMLSTVPVHEDVRQFLLRVWSEVLALAAVRRGPQDAQTMHLKQAAVDLLWAASPKADRAERQQITQYLPGILKTLREGMQTLAMAAAEQDEHIGLINQAVTQAFHAQGQSITPSQMNELACALAGLEDVVTDDPEGDLLLDPSLLEQMLGVDSQDLQVISAGGARPDPDMLQWARELQPGQWLTLCYQGAPVRVQYVWRSARGQLHLFAASSGRSYLVQTRRLAAYLQAGLMAPVEDQALTIRATNEALTRLDQEPDLLLG
ncbi:MAG: DUF1631 domain-containing protein [Burkholderiaceae bacterium]|jgi:hypothetical protein|nr:DUF1631 domain-containing protein [Burkholderiaceae bacterium]